MARFGQGMIQALTQPSYMQGLYEAAKGVGEMPARRRLQGMLAGMQPGSAEYYRVLAENEKDPVKAAALGQQANQIAAAAGTVQGTGLINQKYREMQNPELTFEDRQALESEIADLGAQYGVDVRQYVGSAQKYEDNAAARENARLSRARLQREEEAAALQAREDQLKSIYLDPRLSEEDRKAFRESAAAAPHAALFQSIDRQLDQQKITDAQLARLEVDSKADVNFNNLENRIEAMPDGALKTDLEERLKSAQDRIPNLEAGGTWNPGDRNAVITEIRAISNAITQNAVNQESAIATETNRIRNELRDIDQQLKTVPNITTPVLQAYATEARNNLDVGRSWYSIPPTNAEISDEARRLAIQAREDSLLNQRQSLLVQLESLQTTTSEQDTTLTFTDQGQLVE